MKKLLCLTLALILALSLLPVTTLADVEPPFAVTADGVAAGSCVVEEDGAHPVDSYGWDYGTVDVYTVPLPSDAGALTLDFTDGGHKVCAYAENDADGFISGIWTYAWDDSTYTATYVTSTKYTVSRGPVGSTEAENDNAISIGPSTSYSDIWLWVQDVNGGLEYIIAFDDSASQLQSAVTGSAEYMLSAVPKPGFGDVGGEWAVLGLARSGCDVPDEYYQGYYTAVADVVADRAGVLHESKYTDYSRVILALTAIGRDATDVAGYDLTTPLGDFDKTTAQGVNGPVWALIALDAGAYDMPQCPTAATQATRQMYVDEILSRQLPDGGWSMSGSGGSEPDMTGMALQALAKYRSQGAVAAAVDEALTCLSAMQNGDGGFAGSGAATLEGAVQVAVALCELGIPLDDARFEKNGSGVMDYIMACRLDDGSFTRTPTGLVANQMATEQGLYCLAAALRAANGQSSLYRMDDAIDPGDSPAPEKGQGLPGKHGDVSAMPVTLPGASFDDIAGSANAAAIVALAERGIINGKGGGLFDPDACMTRAEFAAIVTRGLGLSEDDTGAFSDVASDKWYAGYIGAANKYGIINGVGGGLFNPDGTLTRKEAAVMVARAAALCGMDAELESFEILNILAQFGDYITIADWARDGMAFCYSEDILDQSALDAQPDAVILRCELAQMLFNMLTKAELV